MRVEESDKEINLIIDIDEAQSFAKMFREAADQTGGPDGERFGKVATGLNVAMSNYMHRTGRTPNGLIGE